MLWRDVGGGSLVGWKGLGTTTSVVGERGACEGVYWETGEWEEEEDKWGEDDKLKSCHNSGETLDCKLELN